MHGTTAQGSSPVVLKRPALNVPVHFAADRPVFPENMVSVCICSLAHQVLYASGCHHHLHVAVVADT